jgi:hypothetical protein
MKKYKFLAIIITVALIAGVSIFFACEKEEKTSQSQNSESQIQAKAGSPWWVVALQLIPGIHVVYQSGLYREVIKFSPDGTPCKEIHCDPPYEATCLFELTVKSTGKNLSSDGITIQSGNEIPCILGFDNERNIVLAIDYSANPEACDKFFYSNVVDFTYSYTIDDPEVLQQLHQTEKITIFGQYDIHETSYAEQIIKYIILKTAD